jgi:hypothetical protein
MCRLPSPNTSTIYAEHPRDVDRCVTLLEQRNRTLATPL